MAAIRAYCAASLDGYIATPDGAVDWLEPFRTSPGPGRSYSDFIQEIATVVMGRATFDQILGFDVGWYDRQEVIVLTHRPVETMPPRTEIWSGDVEPLLPRLRATKGGDVWIVGGAEVQRAFLDAGALDRIELSIIPVLLGDGVPLWPRSEMAARLLLRRCKAGDNGVVALDYDILPER